eukprot:1854895-Rhodomonas_salina.1
MRTDKGRWHVPRHDMPPRALEAILQALEGSVAGSKRVEWANPMTEEEYAALFEREPLAGGLGEDDAENDEVPEPPPPLGLPEGAEREAVDSPTNHPLPVPRKTTERRLEASLAHQHRID